MGRQLFQHYLNNTLKLTKHFKILCYAYHIHTFVISKKLGIQVISAPIWSKNINWILTICHALILDTKQKTKIHSRNMNPCLQRPCITGGEPISNKFKKYIHYKYWIPWKRGRKEWLGVREKSWRYNFYLCKRQRDLPPTNTFPKYLQHRGLGHVKARNTEFNLSLPHG